MQTNDIGWATFFNEASTDFSTEFQTEMSNQLMEKFNSLMGIGNFAEDKEFALFVGMEDMKTIYKDGYAFSLVEVLAPSSETKILTIYWKSKDNKNIVKSHLISAETVEFGWAADFDVDFFKRFAKENVISEINGEKLKFKFVADVETYPDLMLYFTCKKKPTKDQLNKIKTLLVENLPESYISDISEKDGKFHIMLDFQGTNAQKGLNQFQKFITHLNSTEIGDIIESIKIR